MSTAYILNAATSLCALIITLLLAVASALSADGRRPIQRWFLVTVLINLCFILAEFAIGLLSTYQGAGIFVALRLIDFFSYALTGLQIFSFGMYLQLYFRSKANLSKKEMDLITAISIGAVVMAILAQWGSLYGYFDEANHYHKQPTFWLSLVLPTCALGVYTAWTARHIQYLKTGEWVSLLMYSLVPFVCYLLEMIYPEIWISHLGSSLTIMMIYMNIQVELKHQLRLQQTQLIENRIAVMLSQIQPHFLYNALTTIDDLIYQDPDAAHKAILDFSSYLRNNMDSLSQKSTIAFLKELEHTQQYLRIEQLRFQQRLRIVYDIQAENFQLPVLTLQPMVENAVRHGITKRRNGGTLTIRTEERGEGYRITVADDGIGFDVDQQQPAGRSHNGIANVRNRLAALCGGSLTLHSVVGEGTTAMMDIPRKEQANEHHAGGR